MSKTFIKWIFSRVPIREISQLQRMVLVAIIPAALLLSYTLSHWHNPKHEEALYLQLLPITLAILLWFRLIERHGKYFTLAFSPFWALAALSGFILSDLSPNHEIHIVLALIATSVSILIFLSAAQIFRAGFQERWPAILALIIGYCCVLYKLTLTLVWTYMCRVTAWGIAVMLHLIDSNLAVQIQTGKPIIEIRSNYFGILLMKKCSGLEGITLFYFMLSLLLIVDWDLFKGRKIGYFFLFGFFYMFCANILRITALFLYGSWARIPGVDYSAQVTAKLPIYLFHSYVGWVFYLLAFALFLPFLYRKSPKQ